MIVYGILLLLIAFVAYCFGSVSTLSLGGAVDLALWLTPELRFRVMNQLYWIMLGSADMGYDDIIKEFHPDMCGIGPFIPHHDTDFRDKPAGTLEQTLTLLAVIRLMQPHILLPSTTALGTIHPKGRELGILSGANVVMPNLSPGEHRKDYSLYDNKICTGDEAAECIRCLSLRMQSIGYQIVTDRGDFSA